MKKKTIFLSTMLLGLLAGSAIAQPYWGGSSGTIPTFTDGTVGIGTLATPTTAHLLVNTNIGCHDVGLPEIKMQRGYADPCISPTAVIPNFLEAWASSGFAPGNLLTAIDRNGWLNINPQTSTSPGDAQLHISGYRTGGYSAMNVPEIKLDRLALAGSTVNYFELWKTTVASGSFTHNLVDVINKDGWLGINTSAPLQALHVNGNGLFEGGQLDLKMPTDGGWRNVDANSYIHGVTMSAGPEGAYMQLRAKFNSDPGAITIACGNGENGSGTTFFSFDGASGPWHHLMRIKPNGKVAIGESIIAPENLPGEYNLYVSKGILTEKLKVALPSDFTNWSDFVFNADYKLMPLSEVEEFINENKHLPEIPSASEVVRDGVDMVSMDAKLLQKIEELTLYVISLQKEVNDLKKKTGK